jgi:3-hydroxyacyl-[acyl-carrier-protein] dehydratase
MTSSAPSTEKLALPVDINHIIGMLPHRYPFLLIDRVIAFEPHKSLVAVKNVTINEPFFQGHFPGRPVMPGVLIIEALAQASGVLTQLSQGGPAVENPLYYLVKVDKARFSQVVVPGDQLRLEVSQKRMLRRMGLYDCRAVVDGSEGASAEILCAERGRE